MKTALVSGASSGIGKSICERLLADGYQIYGIGRDFSDCTFPSSSFFPLVFDLRKPLALPELLRTLPGKNDISLLVNCAGTGYYGLHEELHPSALHEMLAVNLEAPMILTQQLMRQLKACRGTILNVSSVTALQKNAHGCAYGATKAGLTSFMDSLFEECRKYGVRVITLHPDMTQTKLYRHADFTADDDPYCHLLPEEVADAAMYALSCREGMVLTDLTIRPQKHRLQKKPSKDA